MHEREPPAPALADSDPNLTTSFGAGSAATVAAAATRRYTLGEEIARGGMGVIYRATDQTLGREVAVKVLHDRYSVASGAAQRFADEARIAGQLQHPAIPPVHDLGTLPDGRPFLAMKLIKGATLGQLLDDRTGPAAERGRYVAVFEQVCQALAYAHSHGVIHRDLKPANVMVGSFGEVQVMDWGLAKVLPRGSEETGTDPELTADVTQVGSLRDSDGTFTQAGSALGTPAFMPPEQALGALGKIDARSDVFGLGAILAVILTGQPPFAGQSAETTRIQAAQGSVAGCFARLDACGAESELVALCKRCLSPLPADRPADAAAVATAVAELRAAADARARRAELDTAAAQAQTLEARKRQRLARLMAGSLLLAAALTGWLALRAAESARRADDKAAEAATAARQTMARAYLSDMRLVQRFWDDGLVAPFADLLNRQRPPQTGGVDLRGFEWFYWKRQRYGTATLTGHTGPVFSVALTADGTQIVSGSHDKTLKVWDAGTGQELRTLKGHTDQVLSVATSASGPWVISGSADHTVKVWDVRTGQEIRILKGHADRVNGVAISADGKRIVSGSWDKTVRVWDRATGQELHTLTGHASIVISVAISTDGKRIVSGSSDRTAKVWNADTGQELRSLAGHEDGVHGVAISTDGKRVVSCCRDGSAKVWDADTGQELRPLKGHTSSVWNAVFSADGTRIITASLDRTAKLWDADTGQQINTFRGHVDGVYGLAISADGKRVITGGSDGTIKVWNAELNLSTQVLAQHRAQVTAVAFSPDGSRVASAAGDWDGPRSRYVAGELTLWDGSGKALTLLQQEAGVTCVAFSPDGGLLACGSGAWDAKANRYTSGVVRLWSADGRPVATLNGHSSSVLSLAFSPDGRLLASAAWDGSVAVWDVTTRQKAFDLPSRPQAVTAVAFSPDGALLAAGGFDALVLLHDLRRHEQARVLTPPFDVSGLAFSPDGAWLAVAGYTGSGAIPLYEVATGNRHRILTGHTDQPTAVAFSPDGSRVASCGSDRTVRLWDAASGQEVLTLRGHRDIVRGVGFSKDGRRLVSGGWDRTVRVWDATPLAD